MTLREPPALTEPPDDGEFYAWEERAIALGYLRQWSQDTFATIDPEDYAPPLRDAIEEVLRMQDEVYMTLPEYADRYEDRAA